MSARPIDALPAIRGRSWRFERLFDAPHRLAFAAAAVLLTVSSIWWAVTLFSSSQGVPVRWALSPALSHSVVMTFGFMPLFFAGFLFTAGPKWLALPPVPARSLLPHISAAVAGWLVFLLSVHGRDPAFGHTLGAIGLGAVVVGWTGISLRFIALLAASTQADKIHARIVAVACIYGVAALCACVVGLATRDDALVQAATRSSLWAFVGLVFAAVSHRMIPFLSSAAVPALDAWRPLWLLWLVCGVFVAKAFVAVDEALAGLPSGPLSHAMAAVEIVAGVGLLALAMRWAAVQSVRIRLLAMLQVGFAWLGFAVLLSGAARLLPGDGQDLAFRLAPLHAYTMGFLGSTMFAMVTRVSSGHGGRAVVADDFVWRLFWVLQLAIVCRVAASTVDAGSMWVVPLLASAAAGWAGVTVAWSVRYGNGFGMPRADGRPG